MDILYAMMELRYEIDGEINYSGWRSITLIMNIPLVLRNGESDFRWLLFGSSVLSFGVSIT